MPSPRNVVPLALALSLVGCGHQRASAARDLSVDEAAAEAAVTEPPRLACQSLVVVPADCSVPAAPARGGEAAPTPKGDAGAALSGASVSTPAEASGGPDPSAPIRAPQAAGAEASFVPDDAHTSSSPLASDAPGDAHVAAPIDPADVAASAAVKDPGDDPRTRAVGEGAGNGAAWGAVVFLRLAGTVCAAGGALTLIVCAVVIATEWPYVVAAGLGSTVIGAAVGAAIASARSRPPSREPPDPPADPPRSDPPENEGDAEDAPRLADPSMATAAGF